MDVQETVRLALGRRNPDPGHGFPMTACGYPTQTGTPCQNEVTLFTPRCAAGHRPLRGAAYAPAMAPHGLRPAVFDAEELAGEVAEIEPGEYLRDELEERGWTERELAEILGWPVQAVSETLDGRKEITQEAALALGEALGTSAELWTNLQAAFDERHGTAATNVPSPDASPSSADDVEDLISWFETPYVRPDANRTERSRLWAGCVAPVPRTG